MKQIFLCLFLVAALVGCGTNGSITITTTTLPAATIGTAYSQTLAATGGTTPYTWSVTSGTLPSGITLSTSGVISGTPTSAGSTFTVSVSDSSSSILTNTQSLIIQSILPAGQNVTLASGQSIMVPSGTTVTDTNNNVVTVNGDNNTIYTTAGAVVAAPSGDTSIADNTVVAQ